MTKREHINYPDKMVSVYYNTKDTLYYFDDLQEIPKNSIHVTYGTRIGCLHFIEEIENYKKNNPNKDILINGIRVSNKP
jgi:hypothetical protein